MKINEVSLREREENYFNFNYFKMQKDMKPHSLTTELELQLFVFAINKSRDMREKCMNILKFILGGDLAYLDRLETSS